MDCSASEPSPLSDEPQTPLRSPSRLDFCMEDPDEGDDSPTQRMDWSCTSSRMEYPPLLIVEGSTDDPPQATEPDAHNTPDMFFAPPEQIDQIVIEPQAPVPVRPPSVQMHVDTQESVPPSRVAGQRLNYPHHGFSRSALLQQKTFWNSRHEEWAEWQSRMQQGNIQKQESKTNDAYTGLTTSQPRVVMWPPPCMRTPPSGLERDLADHPPRKHEQDIHASIYPRVGDISALRDPYSVNIDRSFFRLPLWTLHKTLYSFDMQQRSASLASSPPAPNAAYVQASTSSSTLSSYSSSTSGDDEESDSTLVADDSPFAMSQCLLGPLKSAPSPHCPPSWNRFCGWELSWYARWGLLLGIFQRDHTKFNAFDAPVKAAPLESWETPSSPPKRIFRFTVGEDEDHNEDDEEEEEDYGMLVANSSFSVDFDEECERALAFYSRESKYSEAAM
ncbi:hypothetical protein EV363DRAFT_1394946 [Boletus edulis]|nr:hypothetical protein EV363DRAFT_1394946 [Boletus edulis]